MERHVEGFAPIGHACADVPVCSSGQPPAMSGQRVKRPVILAVDDDPGVLAEVVRDLRHRFGDRYRVMQSASGVEALEMLLGRYPTAAVIVYGSIDDTRSLAAAIVRGARGFLMWDANNPIASPARQHASNFGRLASNGETIKAAARLTERELQILRGMTHGYSNGEIGRKLFLSEDTVKTHARRLFQKLGAHDRAHAVALGLRNDLVA